MFQRRYQLKLLSGKYLLVRNDILITMPKRKRPRDLNQLAKFIVDVSTGEAELPECQPDGKNPAAVELGKLGGKKGGKARAQKLSAEERSAIARNAAKARWNKTS
jgi:hypothetical protein